MYINLVVEDDVQEQIVRKVLSTYAPATCIQDVFGKRGNTYIRDRLAAFNQAARFYPYIVLTDLDQVECAPRLITQWIKFSLHPHLLFRVAVREAEAWLLADPENLAGFLGVSVARIAKEPPEAIVDPKAYLIQIARQSRKRALREALVANGTARVGKQYNSTLAQFIHHYWNVEQASQRSHSLLKFIRRVQAFPGMNAERRTP